VRWGDDPESGEKIKRIINPKYPYEYLRDDVSGADLEAKLMAAEKEFAEGKGTARITEEL